MKKLKRIFYVGMITTDTYGMSVGEKTYDGAAARKMTSVAFAMRSVGHRAIMVSLPFIGSKAKRRFYPAVITSEGRTPAVFLATLRSKYLRKIISPFTLAVFALRRVARGDTVILYNHYFEYSLALAVLRLKRVRVILDIEDAPNLNERGVRGLLSRLSFAWTFSLTAKRKMVVADHVARGLGLDDYVVIQGVVSEDASRPSQFDAAKWTELQAGGDLRLHFGGSLLPDTGVDLFCKTVERLAQEEDRLVRRIVFKVTGVGELDKISDLQARIQPSRKVHIELLAELCKANYIGVLDTCHGSLSLRRPVADLSDKTFPSKVIEITAAGLALVSTRQGDVPTLFSDESAFFIKLYEPADLANIIVEMARSPNRVETVAKNGHDVCYRAFSAKMVGEKLAKLL